MIRDNVLERQIPQEKKNVSSKTFSIPNIIADLLEMQREVDRTKLYCGNRMYPFQNYKSSLEINKSEHIGTEYCDKLHSSINI